MRPTSARRRSVRKKGDDVLAYSIYLPKAKVKKIEHLAVDLEVSRTVLVEHILTEALAGRVDLSALDPKNAEK